MSQGGLDSTFKNAMPSIFASVIMSGRASRDLAVVCIILYRDQRGA